MGFDFGENADELAAVITITVGAIAAGYTIIMGIDVSETTTMILTMLVATPLGFLFGQRSKTDK